MSGLLLPLGPRPQGALCSNAVSHRRHTHVISLNPHLNPFPDEKTWTQRGWGSYLFKAAHCCREVGSPKSFPLKPGSLPIGASRQDRGICTSTLYQPCLSQTQECSRCCINVHQSKRSLEPSPPTRKSALEMENQETGHTGPKK